MRTKARLLANWKVHLICFPGLHSYHTSPQTHYSPLCLARNAPWTLIFSPWAASVFLSPFLSSTYKKLSPCPPRACCPSAQLELVKRPRSVTVTVGQSALFHKINLHRILTALESVA